MSGTKFTPGPLKVIAKQPNGFHYEISNVEIPEGSATTGIQEDWLNAYFNISGYFGSYGPHVFAAAPELYEALEEVFSSLSAGDDRSDDAWVDLNGTQVQMIVDALAKARGES